MSTVEPGKSEGSTDLKNWFKDDDSNYSESLGWWELLEHADFLKPIADSETLELAERIMNVMLYCLFLRGYEHPFIEEQQQHALQTFFMRLFSVCLLFCHQMGHNISAVDKNRDFKAYLMVLYELNLPDMMYKGCAARLAQKFNFRNGAVVQDWLGHYLPKVCHSLFVCAKKPLPSSLCPKLTRSICFPSFPKLSLKRGRKQALKQTETRKQPHQKAMRPLCLLSIVEHTGKRRVSGTDASKCLVESYDDS